MSLFFLFLGIAAWQDLRTRSISLEVLTAGAAAGMAVCVLEGRVLEEIVPAMIPGIALLLINRFADGIIGEGDGLFFLVAGFFLEWKEIVLLLISGQFFCGIFGLAIAVRTVWPTKLWILIFSIFFPTVLMVIASLAGLG